jgi:hypothetical protein
MTRKCATSLVNNEEKLKSHEEDCLLKKSVRIEIPKEGECIHFQNYQHTMKVTFVIYADFECSTKKVNTCQPDPESSYNEI